MPQLGSCPGCGCSAWLPSSALGCRFRGVHHRRVRCSHCGLVGLNPLPGPESWVDLYSDSYFEAYSVHHAPTKGYVEGRTVAEESGQRRLKALAHVIPRGRLLDVGCAGGHFLGVARAFGYEVTGVEYNSSMASAARERGLTVLQGDVMQLEIPGRFDVVHLEDVLEHMPDPYALLRRLTLNLTASGVVVVDGPLEDQRNLSAWLLRLNRSVRGTEDPEMAPSHLWLFSLRSQRQLFERAGYVERWKRVYEDTKPPIPMTGSWQRNLRRNSANAVQRLSTAISNSGPLGFLRHGDRALSVFAPDCRHQDG
jgi:SAM-dependent methyltransferase